MRQPWAAGRNPFGIVYPNAATPITHGAQLDFGDVDFPMFIIAAKKLPGEGFKRPLIKMDESVKAKEGKLHQNLYSSI